MKRFICMLSGALVVFGLSLGAPDAWAQARGHGGGGGGGGTRTPSGGGGGGGGTAVSRGSGGSGGGHVSSSGGSTQASGSGGSTRASGSGGSRTASTPPSSDHGAARPRDGGRPNYGNPVVGQAVERPGSRGYAGYPYSRNYRNYGHNYWYSPYSPYYLYGYGAFGLGYLYYDPYWWGYPYSYPYGGYYGPYGGGYYGGYDRDDYYGSGGGSYGGYDSPRQDLGPKGGLKLKVEPSNAEVYVDGYFVGTVDDYNSPFQRLSIPAGTHRVEIRAPGYQSLTFDVKIEPRVTISYSAQLQAAR